MRSWRPRYRATDWNIRSTGAPASTSPIVVVTWDNTQDWTGMS